MTLKDGALIGSIVGGVGSVGWFAITHSPDLLAGLLSLRVISGDLPLSDSTLSTAVFVVAVLAAMLAFSRILRAALGRWS